MWANREENSLTCARMRVRERRRKEQKALPHSSHGKTFFLQTLNKNLFSMGHIPIRLF